MILGNNQYSWLASDKLLNKSKHLEWCKLMEDRSRIMIPKIGYRYTNHK